ncbi:helix-turn-helix domain-containing protein [Lysinibacillus sp. NPDC096418]|uniref:helix-turn-helix domain-containing protein n=1 Tax=Lysinibacillus sp. NPDC096418 TaxID=3364138 RepID=UPI003803B3B4
MDKFIPYVNTLGDDGIWRKTYYPNLKLTIKRLKDCRAERRLSIEEFSKLTLIDKDNLMDIESGEPLMSPSFLKLIADFYMKPTDYFLCADNSGDEQLILDRRRWEGMSHFEYMEQQGQLNIFDFLSVQELDSGPITNRKPSTVVNKIVDIKKYKGASKRGYIVRR